MNKDDNTYQVAGIILRAGMYLSFAIMLGGLVWVLIQNASAQTPEHLKAIAPDKLFMELTAGNPVAVVSLGVILLLFTPGVTLLSTVVTFTAARNWRFAGIALLIALILLLSLSISLKWIKLF